MVWHCSMQFIARWPSFETNQLRGGVSRSIGMGKDFSWKASAIEYARLYQVAWNSRNRSGASTSNQPGATRDRNPQAALTGKGSNGR